MPNLTPRIAFSKFGTKYGTGLMSIFCMEMPNFSIGTPKWHCIGDALND